jgi:lipopolysaccharide transport system ATP-binding protein
MSTVIKVENLSKKYRLGVINRQMLYRDIQSWVAKMRGKEDPNSPVQRNAAHKHIAADEDFWALKDVNFEIKDGEAVAVIGRNGAGKSTLLKILSQITAPSEGRALMKGRVASMLEVGTGFHPELTGRENVYLNGAILGMTKRDIDSKFDEIAAFSGVEDFLETPVKRYSSGMRVRLAFAVAAHLEPEILIIDEVLAVGDASFQQKCLGKIGEVAGSGRTVLFVSHNAAAVESLCRRGIVLEQGRVVFDGTQTGALNYYADTNVVSGVCLRDRKDRTGTGELRVVEVEIRNSTGRTVQSMRSGEDADVWLHFENPSGANHPQLNARFNVTTLLGTPVFTQSNQLAGQSFGDLPERGAFVCRIPRLPLPAASYRVEVQLSTRYRQAEMIDAVSNAFEIHVEDGDFFGTGLVPSVLSGVALVPAQWRMESNHHV